jgi:hypothetical protein
MRKQPVRRALAATTRHQVQLLRCALLVDTITRCRDNVDFEQGVERRGVASLPAGEPVAK